MQNVQFPQSNLKIAVLQKVLMILFSGEYGAVCSLIIPYYTKLKHVDGQYTKTLLQHLILH
jgi:hypothetical protein